MQKDWKKAQEALENGGIAVVPTDTLYGILAKASNKKAVERIYDIKGRDNDKPFIILITDYKDLEKFNIKIKDESVFQEIEKYKNKKVSFILPCVNKKFIYLHRGKNALAFRIIKPKNKNLFNLIKKIGPLVAPSANPQGLAPAKNRKEARMYFGKKVDAYVCSGTRNTKPSTVISFVEGQVKVLRK